MAYNLRGQRGDTLTEVMFATAIVAFVIVIAVTSMNRSLAQTQSAVESTFVSQSIDAEAELLRYARDQYRQDQAGAGGALWRGVLGKADANSDNKASVYGTCDEGTGDGNLPGGSFYISDSDLNDLSLRSVSSWGDIPTETFAGIGHGLWVEAVKSPAHITVPYVDLHIRACWEPPFDGPKSTLGTIVRLYYSLDNPDDAIAPPPPQPAPTLSLTESEITLCPGNSTKFVGYTASIGNVAASMPTGDLSANVDTGSKVITVEAPSIASGSPPNGDYNGTVTLTAPGGVVTQPLRVQVRSGGC